MRQVALLLLCAVSCAQAPLADRPCLRCSEIETRDQEDLLCRDSFLLYWEPVLQCRCAPSAPCEAACGAWCDGGPPDADCWACSQSACAGKGSSCAGDVPPF